MKRLPILLEVSVLLVLLVLLTSTSSVAQDLNIPVTTSDRLLSKGWWPTKGTEPRSQFVGAEACSGCHKQKMDTQQTTPMAHASASGNLDKSGASGPFIFHAGKYTYTVRKGEGGLLYSADDGIASESASVGWVFGSGHFGQTYVFDKNGTFFESNLSYYPAIQALDFTTGHRRAPPPNLTAALGQPQTPDTIHSCFGCHSTASTTSGRFDSNRLMNGVTCEACHGPGAQHVAAMTLGRGDQASTFIMNPASLAPSDSVDFCGACHRTRLDAIETGITGVLSIRFPAPRLQVSRCWGSQGDRRLTCMACHDPHVPLVTNAVSYDRNCLSCHVTSTASKPPADHPGKACPVAQKECTTCHMPKYEIKEMHAKFTDHKIAIHREGDPFRE